MDKDTVLGVSINTHTAAVSAIIASVIWVGSDFIGQAKV